MPHNDAELEKEADILENLAKTEIQKKNYDYAVSLLEKAK